MLKISQINHQALVARYKALKIQSEDLVVSRKSVPKGKALKVYLESMNKEISLAGGRFCMVGELWVDKDMLDLPFPENFDLDDAQVRYQNLDTRAHGTIAELYRDLKPHLWGYLADDELRPLFKEHASVNLLLCRCPRLISLHSSWTSSIKNVEMWCIWHVHMLPGY